MAPPVLFGGDGKDKLSGDDGHDVLKGKKGDDELFCGDGVDMADGGVHVSGDSADPDCELVLNVP